MWSFASIFLIFFTLKNPSPELTRIAPLRFFWVKMSCLVNRVYSELSSNDHCKFPQERFSAQIASSEVMRQLEILRRENTELSSGAYLFLKSRVIRRTRKKVRRKLFTLHVRVAF